MINKSPNYSMLEHYLAKQAEGIVLLSFDEIEHILTAPLPASASKYDVWWNAAGHLHAQTWEKSGYKAINVSVNRLNKRMEFAPITQGAHRHNFSQGGVQRGFYVAGIIRSDSENISVNGYTFCNTPFEIYERDIPSPFLQHRGRMVGELLKQWQYSSLEKIVSERYPQFMNSDIQEFMTYLVGCDDKFYQRFLNEHGGDNFCRFGLIDNRVFYLRGLYLYTYNDDIVYIGRCRDNFYTRFNVNYGKIHPKNCYKDGQSTNTRMNAKINRLGGGIRIHLCALTDEVEIVEAETLLIAQLKPSWNRKK